MALPRDYRWIAIGNVRIRNRKNAKPFAPEWKGRSFFANHKYARERASERPNPCGWSLEENSTQLTSLEPSGMCYIIGRCEDGFR